MSALSNARKSRGVVRGLITRLTTRLDTLECKADQPATFRKHHYNTVDHINEEDEDTLRQEQEILENHNDEIDDLKIQIKQLFINSSSLTNSSQRKSIN